MRNFVKCLLLVCLTILLAPIPATDAEAGMIGFRPEYASDSSTDGSFVEAGLFSDRAKVRFVDDSSKGTLSRQEYTVGFGLTTVHETTVALKAGAAKVTLDDGGDSSGYGKYVPLVGLGARFPVLEVGKADGRVELFADLEAFGDARRSDAVEYLNPDGTSTLVTLETKVKRLRHVRAGALYRQELWAGEGSDRRLSGYVGAFYDRVDGVMAGTASAVLLDAGGAVLGRSAAVSASTRFRQDLPFGAVAGARLHFRTESLSAWSVGAEIQHQGALGGGASISYNY